MTVDQLKSRLGVLRIGIIYTKTDAILLKRQGYSTLALFPNLSALSGDAELPDDIVEKTLKWAADEE